VLRWRGLEATPGVLGRTVVTIGMYDGIHRGHQDLIGTAVARARTMNRPCLLLTFDPHPAEVVRPGSHPAILTSLDRKAELVAALGGRRACASARSPPTSCGCRPRSSPTRAGRADLHAAQVVVGENFTYGHRAPAPSRALTAEGPPVRVRRRGGSRWRATTPPTAP
jgi:riboflavin kinase/FMN adenylyltransferase